MSNMRSVSVYVMTCEPGQLNATGPLSLPQIQIYRPGHDTGPTHIELLTEGEEATLKRRIAGYIETYRQRREKETNGRYGEQHRAAIRRRFT